MSNRPKLLLLDDDQDLLELYKEILGRLPSKPEIHTATSGARAIALLESETFTLLLSDLNMPKMDGLQVLTIVRRKFPQLRTAVMTSVLDEQFRARAYSMGIDLFLEKPNSSQEITFFLDCIESLLDKETSGGFRGVQSKSLVDIIQLECLSQSSSVLKIINGVADGRIWIHDGEIVDAATNDLSGENAFQRILGWKSGNFEILPPEPNRARTIFSSYQGLLLETAQALDEAQAVGNGMSETPAEMDNNAPMSSLSDFARVNGVELVLKVPSQDKAPFESWGVENAEQMAPWVRLTMKRFRHLGEKLAAGPVNRVECLGPQRHLAIISRNETELCVGFSRSLSVDLVREGMKTISAKWVS